MDGLLLSAFAVSSSLISLAMHRHDIQALSWEYGSAASTCFEQSSGTLPQRYACECRAAMNAHAL
jgi:hypothetical protein